MLRRNKRRIAHRADSTDGTDSLCSGVDCGKEFETKNVRKGLRIGNRVYIPRIRVRIYSILCLMGKMRESCGRILSTKVHKRDAASRGFPANKQRCGLAASSHCSRNSYHAEAIADCIEFIKRSASTKESSSLVC